jgi:hypothetical protein
VRLGFQRETAFRGTESIQANQASSRFLDLRQADGSTAQFRPSWDKAVVLQHENDQYSPWQSPPLSQFPQLDWEAITKASNGNSRKFDNKSPFTRGAMPQASSQRHNFAKTTASSHHVQP